ncbi:MAG: hypothetical protein K0S25_1032 [Bacillus sp. (in: firmicutes)]|jgi:hypothetical protein|nr:hypothetical protein [Bacillus sp. (in: firmicutes)]
MGKYRGGKVMKKHVYLWGALVLLMIVLTSCSQSGEEKDDTPKMLDVKLTVNPTQVQPNEMITFKADVTYGKEKVTDADEVTFEFWRSKDEKHQKVKVAKATNGVYQLEKSFTTEGTYYVISHVTAESMHSMPRVEFVVGSPSEPEPAHSAKMDM